MLTLRVDTYILQSNRVQFTPAQIRRMRKKMNRDMRIRGGGAKGGTRVNVGWFKNMTTLRARREMLVEIGRPAAHSVRVG